jgi:hypothetical protein
MAIYHDKTVKVASKNCDKFLNYIDRVMGQALFFVSVPVNCLGIDLSFLIEVV